MQTKKPQNKPATKTSPVKGSVAGQKKLKTEMYDAKLVRMLGLIVAAAGIIIYLQTLSFDFALDDYSAIIENRQTKQGTAAFWDIFKSSYRFGYNLQGDELYRPLSKAIFAVVWQMSPNNSTPGHLINILFYGLTGFFLFTTLARFIRKNIYIPFIASLLFIAHPIHAEVVSNIKSLDEILAFFFFIVSLNFIHRYLESNKTLHLVSACACFFLALLSKESSITFILIFPLFIYFFTDYETSKNIKTSVMLLAPALIFLLIRHQVLKDSNGGPPSVADNSLMAAGSVAVQKATAILIMGLYLKLLIFPHPLVFDYSYNQIPLVAAGDWKFLLSLAVYVTVGVYAVVTFKKKNYFSFAVLYFFITSSVLSNLVMLIGTDMAERLMYTPSFGFCFAIAVLLDKFINAGALKSSINSISQFFSERKILTGSVALVILAYSGKVIAYSPVWKDNMSLYESGIEAAPNSTRTHFYLGNAICKPEYYNKFKDTERTKIISRGISELKKSAAIYPSFSEPWAQLGVIYYKTKQYDSAMYFYNKALEVAPFIATIHNNVGTLYFETGKYNEAIAAFAKATQLDPNYSEAWCNLGSAYGTLGQLDPAIQNFREAVKTDPNNAMAYKFLGITYKSKGDPLSAQQYLDKAAELGMK